MKRMTKVLLVVALALGLSTTAFGFSVLSVENHMDFDREIFTTTFTGFATDASGSWFFFLDLDTGADYSFGYAGNYFEVSRDFDVGKLIGADGLSLHFEYNGSTHWKPAALLAGAKMALPVPFLLTASLSAVMYRNWDGSPEPGATWQATLVWSIDLLKDGDQSQIVFTGFVDVTQMTGMNSGKIGFVTEPQLLFNWSLADKSLKDFWLGTEVEINKLVLGDPEVEVRPTVFIRYDF